MASNGNDLFLGGRYLRFAGNQPVAGIAKWDGSKWDALGDGFKVPASSVNLLDLNVNAIVPAGNLVYAGGRFDSTQSGAALNIARKLYVLGRRRGGSASECLLTSLDAQGLVTREEITHGISLASDDEFLYLLLQGSSQKIPALRSADVARWNASQGWRALNSDMWATY